MSLEQSILQPNMKMQKFTKSIRLNHRNITVFCRRSNKNVTKSEKVLKISQAKIKVILITEKK